MQTYQTLADIAASKQTKSGTQILCRENFGFYIVQDSDYTATTNDVTVSNGRVAKFEFIVSGANIKGTSGSVQDDIDSIVAGGLPSQSGNNGKALTTNGTDAQWSAVGIEFSTTSDMESTTPSVDGVVAYNQERSNAKYILAFDGYTAQPGDIVATNGRVWELQDLDNFRAYGDVVDSVDCGPLIQTVLNSGRSNIYKFRGNFTVDTPSRVTRSDITIDCEGAYFDCSNMYGSDFQNNPDALFELYGSQQSATTLSLDAVKSSTVITVSDPSSFSAGNPIYIESDEHWYTEAVSIGRVYVGRVARVSGSDIHLQHALPFDFNISGNTINVYNWTPIRNITVKGGKFYGGNHRRDVGNGRGIGVVYARYFDNVTVEGFKADGFENAAYRMESGLNAKVQNGWVQGLTPEFNETIVEGQNSGFYGVFFVEVRNAKMLNVDGYRCRHLQDASRTFDMLVENCNGVECHRPAFGCHSGTHDGTYNECSVEGGAGGLQWRGFHLYVNGGTYNCPDNDSSGIYDAQGGASDLLCDRVIQPNKVHSDRSAVNMRATFKNCDITGTLETINGGFPCVDLSGDFMGFVSIHDSHINQVGGSGICIRQDGNGSETFKMIKVTSTTMVSDTNLIRILAPASAGSVWVEGNTFDSTATFDINITNTQTFERVEANFRPDGTPATRN